ncbi:MAG TPA: GNAT family N-acetyltransferase [Thermoanaerobaculia bacterium]|nr:GNAT family N-acetyltransferase [Thermoanaerobaculia bacterium]
MRVTLETATADDASALAALRTAVAEHLTRQYGKGFWSSGATEKGALYHMRTSLVCVARDEQGLLIASLRLATKKPWAIDKTYFTPCVRPLYLTDMAVKPELQRSGIGRLCLAEAQRIVKGWPGDAIRLDAFDAEAGAGEFYRKCGYREMGRVVYRNVPLIYFELLL